jgi:hypothetical protein
MTPVSLITRIVYCCASFPAPASSTVSYCDPIGRRQAALAAPDPPDSKRDQRGLEFLPGCIALRREGGNLSVDRINLRLKARYGEHHQGLERFKLGFSDAEVCEDGQELWPYVHFHRSYVGPYINDNMEFPLPVPNARV